MAEDDRNGMTWNAAELGKLIQDLYQRHSARDKKNLLRNALLYRDPDARPQDVGTYIPPPYHKSTLIIKTMTGALVRTAQQWQAQIAGNEPRVNVSPTVRSDRDVSKKKSRDAIIQERFHNGTWHLADGSTLQEHVAWAQSSIGAGWYVTYEHEAGFGLPDRKYYNLDELSQEEIEGGMAADGTRLTESPVLSPGSGEFSYAEHPDLYTARARTAMEDRAVNGRGLFALEYQPDSTVYADRDKQGWKFVAIIERVDAIHYGTQGEMSKVAAAWRGDENLATKGVFSDAGGAIAGGISRGSPAQQTSQSATGNTYSEQYLQCRVWTRNETYVYVCRDYALHSGTIVWASQHDYGEPPCYPAPFTDTGDESPERRWLPGLEAAFSIVPGYNQVGTLLSQHATFNAIPRFVLYMPDGSFYTDPVTGEIPVMGTDSTVGLDPRMMEVVRGGGQIKQLVLEGAGELLNLMSHYANQLADSLPSEAAQGTGGTSGPAWTTTLLQEAQRTSLTPAVKHHAKAIEKVARLQARVVKQRGVPVFVLAAPGKTKSGTRALVNIDPEKISLNITVSQSPNNQQEQLVLLQMGEQLLHAQPMPLITLRDFFEFYQGAEDPDQSERSAWMQLMIEYAVGLRPDLGEGMLAEILDLARGRLPTLLANEIPALGTAVAAQSLSERAQTPAGGGLTRGAGVVGPGINAPLTLEGTGTQPVGPAPGYEQQAQNSPVQGAPAF